MRQKNVVMKMMLSRFMRTFTMSAYAEESTGEQGDGEDSITGSEESGNAPSINFEDLITKARMDEKNKQYSKIKRLEEANADLTKKQNDLLLKVGTLEQQLDEANKKLTQVNSGDSEEVKTLKDEVERLKGDLETANKKIKEFEDKPPVDRESVEKEIRDAVEKEYEIKLYRQEVLAPYANDKTVISDLVFGDTKEDIDASLKLAIERSNEIKSSLGFNHDGSIDKRKSGRTPSASANPSAGESSGDVDTLMKQLAQLDPRSKEYAELRKKLGF